MTSSSSPVTAPTERVSIVRQGRHLVGEPADPLPDLDLAVPRWLSRGVEAAALSERPLAVKQRIARDRGHLRRLRRALPDLADSRQRFEIEEAMRTLAASVRDANRVLDRLVRDGRTRRWGPSNFEAGDQARYLSAWCEVVAVGPLGMTVRPVGHPDGLKMAVEYSKITGRRRHGVESVDAA